MRSYIYNKDNLQSVWVRTTWHTACIRLWSQYMESGCDIKTETFIESWKYDLQTYKHLSTWTHTFTCFVVGIARCFNFSYLFPHILPPRYFMPFEPNYEISNQILLHSFLIDTKISILLLWKLISMSNVDQFHGAQLFCMRDCIDKVQQICLWSSFNDGDFITCALWCAYIHSIEQSKIKRKPHLLGDSSSVVSAAGGVVTVDDDWWCEWWFLWCDNIRCDWWWCEWECALFELAELVEGCGGGGNPCDFVIVNSPFDVVNLSGTLILCKWNFGNFQKTRRRKQ